MTLRTPYNSLIGPAHLPRSQRRLIRVEIIMSIRYLLAAISGTYRKKPCGRTALKDPAHSILNQPTAELAQTRIYTLKRIGSTLYMT